MQQGGLLSSGLLSGSHFATTLLDHACLFSHKGNDATAIPSPCCALPYTVNGELHYNCTVNAAISNNFGCYNDIRQWVTCLQPDGTFFTPRALRS